MRDKQDCTVVPHWIGEVATHRIDEDLVVVELEDDVGEPPVALSQEAVPNGCGSPWWGNCGVQSLLDYLWHWNAALEGETTAWGWRGGWTTTIAERQDIPENMRMVSMPERRWAWESDGLGVVGLEEGIGVAERESSLLSVGQGTRRGATAKKGCDQHRRCEDQRARHALFAGPSRQDIVEERRRRAFRLPCV